eukprot:scaffold85449_cov63-Phaeocystis_antarctica.AAC.2
MSLVLVRHVKTNKFTPPTSQLALPPGRPAGRAPGRGRDDSNFNNHFYKCLRDITPRPEATEPVPTEWTHLPPLPVPPRLLAKSKDRQTDTHRQRNEQNGTRAPGPPSARL